MTLKQNRNAKKVQLKELYPLGECHLSQAGEERRNASQTTITKQLILDMQRDTAERSRMREEREVLLSSFLASLNWKLRYLDEHPAEEAESLSEEPEDSSTHGYPPHPLIRAYIDNIFKERPASSCRKARGISSRGLSCKSLRRTSRTSSTTPIRCTTSTLTQRYLPTQASSNPCKGGLEVYDHKFWQLQVFITLHSRVLSP